MDFMNTGKFPKKLRDDYHHRRVKQNTTSTHLFLIFVNSIKIRSLTFNNKLLPVIEMKIQRYRINKFFL